jgi:hypothetical protein
MIRIDQFQECIDFALEELGDNLISTDIFTEEGLPVVEGYNSNPRAVALFSQISDTLRKTVRNSNFKDLGKFYVVSLENNVLDIVILNEKFQWKLIVDTTGMQLGYLFSIFLPEAIKKFEETVKTD